MQMRGHCNPEEYQKNMGLIFLYLNNSGISPRTKGYRYMADAIYILLYEPNLNGKELFAQVGQQEQLPGGWEPIYKSCDYCLRFAKNEETRNNSLMEYLRHASNTLRIRELP